jgi:hypothetical protein
MRLAAVGLGAVALRAVRLAAVTLRAVTLRAAGGATATAVDIADFKRRKTTHLTLPRFRRFVMLSSENNIGFYELLNQVQRK